MQGSIGIEFSGEEVNTLIDTEMSNISELILGSYFTDHSQYAKAFGAYQALSDLKLALADFAEKTRKQEDEETDWNK